MSTSLFIRTTKTRGMKQKINHKISTPLLVDIQAWKRKQFKGTRIEVDSIYLTLEDILEKYDYHLPRLRDQVINRDIKEVARRAGATLMYLSGIDIYDIMRITGHTTPAMVKKYIKADSLAAVEKQAGKYVYFK